MFGSFISYQSPRTTERFKPYKASTARDRRLEKILYNAAKTTPDLREQLKPTPPRYQYLSMDDKLARLKKLIDHFPAGNQDNQAYSTTNISTDPSPASSTTVATNNTRSTPMPAPPFSNSTATRFAPNYPTGSLVHRILSIPIFNAFGGSTSSSGFSTGSTFAASTATETPLFPKRERTTSFAGITRPIPEKTSSVSHSIISPPLPAPSAQPSKTTSFPVRPVEPEETKPSSLPNNLSSILAVAHRTTGLVTTKWRNQKYKDDQDERKREIERLQRDLKDRTTARHYRGIEDEQSRRMRLKLEGIRLERRIPPREEFPELPLEAFQIIKIIWDRNAPHNEVFASGFGADITRKDLLTLSGTEWLNDEVINFFLNLIVERNKEDSATLPKVYTFNTFFFQKLFAGGFAGVKRWTRKVDIFAHQLLLVPIHLGNHWCMAIVDFDQHQIDYYDSLFGDNMQCLDMLRKYLEEESMDKRKQPFDTSDWKLVCRKDIPFQTNMCDCGMFACLFAEYASRHAPITFNQPRIPYFRQRMVWEICRKKLFV